MSKHNDGGPAYPTFRYDSNGNPHEFYIGKTLRDEFAGQALSGLVGPWAAELESNPNTPENLANLCYKVADAMLAARNKE